MEVHVFYNSFLLRKITKTDTEQFSVKEGSNIEDLLKLLAEKYGELFEKMVIDNNTGNLKMLILLNGSKVAGLKINMNDQDRINILSFITGG